MNDESESAADLAASFPLDGRPGPAPRLTAERSQAMVERAIETWQREPTRPPSRIPGRAAGVAAAAVFVSAAAAAGFWVTRAEAPDAPDDGRTETREVARIAPPVAAKGTAEGAAEEPVIDLEPEAPAEPEPPPIHSRREGTAPRTAEDWMQRASRLRGEGKWHEAEKTYRRVVSEHPGTASAYVARVAAASLRLDRLGDAAGARRLFEEALGARPGGALDIEVRQGIADASRRLGDAGRERAALQALVAAHPHTRAAEDARRRLDSLGAKAP
jgi:tetratricopeptide (TPR) repeat protein